ncbi:conserved hypothetical protein [Paraburkholderia piptadeniae]|uniref:Transmembrane protein n=1 Tax=Paraburkholderia piptadeniae TaxID=1701573 RepID=A0A1N7RRJ9_9BURK|nr:DUF3619 family protein [Paraburkholderia piptadeniae]SIT37696.1 conserved hypothetical protein [Paraburkholderia piptadeniae]
MSSALEIKEIEFARQLRRALDENAARIPTATTDRLAAARHAALARKKPEAVHAPAFVPVFVGAGTLAGMPQPEASRRLPRLRKLALAWPLLALVVGLAGIAWWEDHQRTAELADIDAAMLSDDLPLNAYLDHGFNAYLTRNH